MNDELPDGPEYVFAQAVIDRLAGKKELANYVIPDPFDASDQVNNLALAVAQYDAAIAVMLAPCSLASRSSSAVNSLVRT